MWKTSGKVHMEKSHMEKEEKIGSKISGSNITITAGVNVHMENTTIESRNIIGASGIQQTSQENDIQPKNQLGNQAHKNIINELIRIILI